MYLNIKYFFDLSKQFKSEFVTNIHYTVIHSDKIKTHEPLTKKIICKHLIILRQNLFQNKCFVSIIYINDKTSHEMIFKYY